MPEEELFFFTDELDSATSELERSSSKLLDEEFFSAVTAFGSSEEPDTLSSEQASKASENTTAYNV
jgi:hypothetical protein